MTEEPLLKELLTYVARDESRHHAYGVQYIERCVPCLSDSARTELEDFALECARSLIDRNAQGLFTTLLQIWAEVGVDPAAMFQSLHDERDEILRDADIAMYAAKAAQEPFRLYTPDIDSHSPSRLALAAELRRALDFEARAQRTRRRLRGEARVAK